MKLTLDDPEIAAMATLAGALNPLAEEVRARVLTWARSRYATVPGTTAPAARGNSSPVARDAFDSFATLCELMAACSAETDDQRLLLASAFVSRRNNEDGAFTGSDVNRELKHLGHGIENITRALDALIAQRPALVVQLHKSGTTRQARKLYKVTDAGVQEVRRMLGAAG